MCNLLDSQVVVDLKCRSVLFIWNFLAENKILTHFKKNWDFRMHSSLFYDIFSCIDRLFGSSKMLLYTSQHYKPYKSDTKFFIEDDKKFGEVMGCGQI